MDLMFDEDVDEVGSDIEAYCPKCRADTTHVVITKYEDEIRRVQCNPCGDVHSYRKPRGELDEEPPEPLAARRRQQVKKPTWEEYFSEPRVPPRPYSFRETYAENDTVDHPKFGVGFVSEILSDDKLEITFRDERRILVHNRKNLSEAELIKAKRKAAKEGPKLLKKGKGPLISPRFIAPAPPAPPKAGRGRAAAAKVAQPALPARPVAPPPKAEPARLAKPVKPAAPVVQPPARPVPAPAAKAQPKAAAHPIRPVPAKKPVTPPKPQAKAKAPVPKPAPRAKAKPAPAAPRKKAARPGGAHKPAAKKARPARPARRARPARSAAPARGRGARKAARPARAVKKAARKRR